MSLRRNDATQVDTYELLRAEILANRQRWGVPEEHVDTATKVAISNYSRAQLAAWIVRETERANALELEKLRRESPRKGADDEGREAGNDREGHVSQAVALEAPGRDAATHGDGAIGLPDVRSPSPSSDGAVMPPPGNVVRIATGRPVSPYESRIRGVFEKLNENPGFSTVLAIEALIVEIRDEAARNACAECGTAPAELRYCRPCGEKADRALDASPTWDPVGGRPINPDPVAAASLRPSQAHGPCACVCWQCIGRHGTAHPLCGHNCALFAASIVTPGLSSSVDPSTVRGTREDWVAAAQREQVQRIEADARLLTCIEACAQVCDDWAGETHASFDEQILSRAPVERRAAKTLAAIIRKLSEKST